MHLCPRSPFSQERTHFMGILTAHRGMVPEKRVSLTSLMDSKTSAASPRDLVRLFLRGRKARSWALRLLQLSRPRKKNSRMNS